MEISQADPLRNGIQEGRPKNIIDVPRVTLVFRASRTPYATAVKEMTSGPGIGTEGQTRNLRVPPLVLDLLREKKPG